MVEPSHQPNADQVDQLRRLLAPGVERLPKLERDLARLKDAKVDVALQLPGAVREASARDDQLAEALAPTLSDAFRECVKNDPQSLVDAISPIMGPAIRQSIRQAIASMTDSFNAALEHSLSLQGLQWRWEAWRTGKTFGEVALMRSLNYRVVQAFLIHRETGLLLQHVATDNAIARDADLFSGMLTAVQDLMNDAVYRENYQSLDAVSIGARPVWVESGPKAVLAVAIEGQPKSLLRETMKQVLESIHVQYADELSDFEGDSAPLGGARRLLERCLEADYKAGRDPTQPAAPALWKKVLAGGVAMTLVTLAAWRITASVQHASVRRVLQPPAGVGFHLANGEARLTGSARDTWIRDAKQRLADQGSGWRWNDQNLTNLDADWLALLDLVESQPGYVIAEAERRDGRYRLRVLRDPLAADFAELRSQSPLSDAELDMQAELFLSPDFLKQRVERLIGQPSIGEVQVQLDGNQLIELNGNAPRAWIRRATEVITALSGAAPGGDITENDRQLYELVDALRATEGLAIRFWEIRQGRLHLVGTRAAGSIAPETVAATQGFSREELEASVEWNWSPEPVTP